MDRAAVIVFAATKNDGKMRELRCLFDRTSWRLERYAPYREVVEGDSSYAHNAALKARALRAQIVSAGVSAGVIADDSGLEVVGLGGRPGVASARYGGSARSWSERRELLLAELAAVEASDRRARFVCALHYISAAGREYDVQRDVRGSIVPVERGDAGFSYDALFAPDGGDRTFAQMPLEEKNAISHRFRAVAALLEAVSRNGRNG